MVSFRPFRELMKQKRITTYYLRMKCGDYCLDSKTINRILKDESVSTNTLDALCQIFSCDLSDVVEILPDTDYLERINKK